MKSIHIFIVLTGFLFGAMALYDYLSENSIELLKNGIWAIIVGAAVTWVVPKISNSLQGEQ